MELKGFVLRSKQIGNRLKHITVFTDKLGKVDFIAKIKRGEFPLKLDLFSLSTFKIVQKGENYELQRALLIRSYFPDTVEKFIYLSKISKLLLPYQLAANRKLFKLVENYFSIGDSYRVAYTMFLLKFAFVEGIFPALTKCVGCGSRQLYSFSIERGGVLCFRCAEKDDIPWSSDLSKLSVNLAKNSFERMKREKIPIQKLDKINAVFENHIRFRFS